MKRLACIVALVTIPVAGSACGGSHRGSTTTSQPRGSAVSATSASSNRLILGGRVRCTATVATPVQVGNVLRVVFSVRNVSQRPIKVQLGYDKLWFVVRGADGTTYDTRQRNADSLGGPFIEPTTIRAGGTETRPLSYVRASWSGPLRITPGCEQTPLPPVRVALTAAGRPPSPGIAVAEVVAASGHLLDNCRPQAAGVPVTGRIDPPSGDAPSMPARCSIALESRRGFSLAQVLVVTPPSLRGVRIKEPYERLAWLKQGQNAEAIAWEFVVTRDGPISVDSYEVDATKAANRMAPDWNWTGSEWQGPGGSRCGGWGGGGGGAAGPMVEFISVCSS